MKDSSVAQVKNHAERVHHISFKKQPSPLSLESCGVLPNLSSLSLVDAGCELPLSWVSSPMDALCDMHIRIAPSENPSLLDFTLQPRLPLARADSFDFAARTFLRVLTFLFGLYISPELLGAITAIPYLTKLHCHATVMESVQLGPFLPRLQPMFPSLASIHFVGKPSVSARIFAKALDILTQLNIYHTIGQDNVDVGPLAALDSSFTLDILRPLSRCIHLHQFTLGSNTPYAITDKDLDSLVAGWPIKSSLLALKDQNIERRDISPGCVISLDT
ncbi:hypothetical protein K474DRAFT_1711100 [Panus rudis PR-1116 ss-1]|nr:hypothetical protein K474DRAFT_1711100 [Panus rudis PR-1116 ss-1]